MAELGPQGHSCPTDTQSEDVGQGDGLQPPDGGGIRRPWLDGSVTVVNTSADLARTSLSTVSTDEQLRTQSGETA